MKSKKRLGLIIDLVRGFKSMLSQDFDVSCFSLIDVGTDHGWLAYDLMKSGVINNCICSDISKNSLKKAQKLFDFDQNLKKNADFRVGDGLFVLNNDEQIDVLVIAGMGAHEIVKILKSSKNKLLNIRCCVFQTATDDHVLAKFLTQNGYKICFDKFVLENGHLYRTIMCVKVSNTTRQTYGFYDKLQTAGVDKELNSVSEFILKNGIDPIYFGKDNLLDNADENLSALCFKKQQIEAKIKLMTEGLDKIKSDEAYKLSLNKEIELFHHLERQVDAIIGFCTLLKDKESCYANQRNIRVSKNRFKNQKN